MPQPKYLPVISAVFITTLIVSNIIAVKGINLFGLMAPAGVIVFPVSYIISDILTEVYGYAVARRTIWIGFFCNLLAVLLFTAAIALPSAPYFTDQSALVSILGATPRILLASFIAYLAGEFTNAFIMAKMKIRMHGKHLWMRTIGSTIVGEGLDSAIFISLAFAGAFPPSVVISLILTQWLLKTAFEIVATPLTYVIVGFLKRREGIDVYDTQTNFNPLLA